MTTPWTPATLHVLLCRRNCRPTTSDDLWLTPPFIQFPTYLV